MPNPHTFTGDPHYSLVVVLMMTMKVLQAMRILLDFGFDTKITVST